MDLTIYLWIAFMIIFSLVVYCCIYCRRFNREAARESNGHHITNQHRSNSDNDISYWANGWPVADLTDFNVDDRHQHGPTESYQGYSHDCGTDHKYSHHECDTGRIGEFGFHHV
ncbi:uncharacterized protein isoform X3 [Choristoneura fumiferana]|uniref:uncharacterized protein isoform X4 n=1 Tax=Choristoneura fumiferana TaxID=7141 RepID=UPI003D15F1E8